MDTLVVDIREARVQLSKLIQAALNGTQVIIAMNDKQVVRLEVLPEASGSRKIGNAKGLILSMDEDFDKPPDEFQKYMQ